MSDILTRIEKEYKLSKQTFQTWREKKGDQFRVIFEGDKTEDKVNINLFASQHKALIALSYADELTVAFDPVGVEDEEIAENREIIAKSDFQPMGLDKQNYQKQSDRATYNVSIRLLEYNEEKNRCNSTILDPLTWYADPSPTGFSGNDYRWHGFETQASLQELKELGYNISNIKLEESEDVESTETKRKQYLGQDKQKDDTDNKIITIYNHYFNDNGLWRRVVCDSNFSVVFEDELTAYVPGDKTSKCPIILNFYNPKRGSATGGECPMDYLEDKQRAESKLFNLQLKKAIREALGGDFLYDPDIITNASQLSSKKEGRRYIKAKAGGRGVNNAMAELPSQRLSVDVDNMRNTLRREAYSETGVDATIQGVRADKSITAKESQTIQQNANLNLALNNKVDSWGERDFWDYVFRLYEINFDDSAKKIARLSVGFGSKTINITKTDFVSNGDIQVRIINKSDKVAEMEQEKLSIPYYQQEANNPDNASIVKLFFKRKIARLSGMSPDEVRLITYDYIEEKAKTQASLLSRNIEIEDIDPEEDQMTYLMIYKRAMDTEAKEKAVEIREDILKEQLKKKITGQGEGMDKMMNNQMMANSMSQQREGTQSASTQDISNI